MEGALSGWLSAVILTLHWLFSGCPQLVKEPPGPEPDPEGSPVYRVDYLFAATGYCRLVLWPADRDNEFANKPLSSDIHDWVRAWPWEAPWEL